MKAVTDPKGANVDDDDGAREGRVYRGHGFRGPAPRIDARYRDDLPASAYSTSVGLRLVCPAALTATRCK